MTQDRNKAYICISISKGKPYTLFRQFSEFEEPNYAITYDLFKKNLDWVSCIGQYHLKFDTN